MPPINEDMLQHLFAQVKACLEPFENERLQGQSSPGKYELTCKKAGIEVMGRKDEVCFLYLLIKSNYVGFYFMPIYTNPEIATAIPAPFLKLLKGKSCFHIKKWDDTLPGQLASVVEIGRDTYRANGWW